MQTIPSPNYSPGRVRPIRLVVLHTAECPCQPGMAAGVMNYLSNASVRASAHYCTDPATTVAGVQERDTAWAAPGANADGIQIEQTARAAFGRPGQPSWSDPEPRRMLVEQTAPLVADICKRYGFPAKLLAPADLLAGERGITDHNRVNLAYGQSDHTDCGVGYPMTEVVAMVKQLMTGGDLGGLLETATTPGGHEVAEVYFRKRPVPFDDPGIWGATDDVYDHYRLPAGAEIVVALANPTLPGLECVLYGPDIDRMKVEESVRRVEWLKPGLYTTKTKGLHSIVVPGGAQVDVRATY